ncbi:DUF6153 family protein [Streptomyces hiroshimensis]|uniref:Uncharacterized protein n=1 Tax=Streptomyces hiroshimensis TaxID=66424 RepID=A0ABQ2Y7L3_9ACTN|nr:DUF6153 family protein [Streptomyces hiroshimensis]GGX72627.1 hypothetical protein GCM10010324_17460 [Streptomyces hiroshimensis]
MIGNGRQGTAAAWCGRLLLLSALLLGIVTMHTLGHPTGHAGMSHEARTHTHATAGAHPQTHSAPAVSPTTSPVADDPLTAPGMDPMSVCLAVLGAALLALVLLLVTAALRRPAAAVAAVRARLLRALWPIPPPPRHKSLARLSVLRV